MRKQEGDFPFSAFFEWDAGNQDDRRFNQSWNLWNSVCSIKGDVLAEGEGSCCTERYVKRDEVSLHSLWITPFFMGLDVFITLADGFITDNQKNTTDFLIFSTGNRIFITNSVICRKSYYEHKSHITNFYAYLQTSYRYDQFSYSSPNSHKHLIEWKGHTKNGC